MNPRTDTRIERPANRRNDLVHHAALEAPDGPAMTGYDPYAVARQILDEYLLDEKGRPVAGPRSHPCVCSHSVAAHVGKLNKGKCRLDGCRCQKYRADTDWALAYDVLEADRVTFMQSMRAFKRLERDEYLQANPKLPGQWSLGPSSAGRCRRAIWYLNLPPADLARAYTDRAKADLGDMLHEEAVRRLRSLYPWRQHERWVTVKGLDRPGRIDSWDPITGTVDDLKTHGKWVANKVDAEGPPLEAWEQAAMYAKALEDDGHPVRWLRLTYIHRDPNTFEPIERGPFRRPYDPEFAEAALQKLLEIASHLDMVHSMNEALRESTGDPDAYVDPEELGVLPRDREGPSSDQICQNCEFRRHCWKQDEAEEHGRSGESWSKLGRDAGFTDEATVWAVRNVYDLGELINDTTDAKKVAESHIQGIPKGRYGDRGELTVYDRKLPNQDTRKTYVKHTAQSVLEREAEQRGEVIELPKPETGGAA
jgi:hypothetical protein